MLSETVIISDMYTENEVEKRRQLSTKKKMYKKGNIIIAELYGSAMNTIYIARTT